MVQLLGQPEDGREFVEVHRSPLGGEIVSVGQKCRVSGSRRRRRPALGRPVSFLSVRGSSSGQTASRVQPVDFLELTTQLIWTNGQRREDSSATPNGSRLGVTMSTSSHFCYIYLIGPEGGRGPFKIGISTRPENRAKQLQTASPRPFAVYSSWHHANPRAVEAEAHRLLAPWHMSGEWFDVSLNRAAAAIMQAISRVNSDSRSDLHYTLDTMRDVIMPVIMPNPFVGAENDDFRIGYARHTPGLDLACQIAWLQAYRVLDTCI